VKSKPIPPHPEPADSPALLLATLFAAHKSADRELERITRRRLALLGIKINFANELPKQKTTKGRGTP